MAPDERLIADYEPWAELMRGEPVSYGGKARATDAWLRWAQGRPSTLAAWTLRDVIEELLERRAEMRLNDGQEGA
jgi:hypothetical protein